MKNLFTTLFRARDKPKDAVSGAPSIANRLSRLLV